MRNEEDLSEVLDRVAAFLGFKTDGSPSGTAKAFAHWLAFAEAFVASPDGQHQATWTEVLLRVVGMRGMMAARSEASEAADVADAALRELVKRFPPRMQHVEPNENSSEMTWQDAAISRGEELARWRQVTGCSTLEQLQDDYEKHNEAVQKTHAELARWQEVTGCETPEEATMIRDDRDLWRSNFLDAERLILSIREALGIPKEGYADVLAVAKTAIVPKPKPEKIEVGQRWVRLEVVDHIDERGPWLKPSGWPAARINGESMIESASYVFLG